MLKRGLIVVAAGAAAVALAIGGSSQPVETPEANLAPCADGGGVVAGAAEGRRATVSAGPVSVPLRPLRSMRAGADGQLFAAMDLVVSGHRFVVVSVPLDLRNRVFLYYGQVVDNRGERPSSRFRAPGYAETEFQPCRDKPRTLWPGGIKVIGAGPVRLLVTVEGRSTSVPLPLGRPRAAPAT